MGNFNFMSLSSFHSHPVLFLLSTSASCLHCLLGDSRAAPAAVHPQPGVQEQGRDVLHATGSGGLLAGEGGGGAGETSQGEGRGGHGVHSKILLWDAVQLRGERTHLSPASQNLRTQSVVWPNIVQILVSCGPFCQRRYLSTANRSYICTQFSTRIVPLILADWTLPAESAFPVSRRVGKDLFLEL